MPSRTNIAVIGRTGACKSSLMQLINGVEKLGVPLDVAVGIRVACEEGARVLLKTRRNAEGGLATAAPCSRAQSGTSSGRHHRRALLLSISRSRGNSTEQSPPV